MDKNKFKQCCEKYRNSLDTNGIGTYKEKTLHKVIKNYYNDNHDNQEIKIGKYVADICKDNEIIEIQTRSFNKLVPKLDCFCQDYNVTVVYPIVYNKWISWIDVEIGTISKNRKSPKTGTIYDSFYELYKIKKHLTNPHCHIVLLLVNVEEYRNLNGWSDNKKRGSSRENQIPIELIDEIRIDDFNIFIPENLNIQFTVNEYSKYTKLPLYLSRIGMTILQYLNVIEVVGKEGKRNIYKRKKAD